MVGMAVFALWAQFAASTLAASPTASPTGFVDNCVANTRCLPHGQCANGDTEGAGFYYFNSESSSTISHPGYTCTCSQNYYGPNCTDLRLPIASGESYYSITGNVSFYDRTVSSWTVRDKVILLDFLHYYINHPEQDMTQVALDSVLTLTGGYVRVTVTITNVTTQQLASQMRAQMNALTPQTLGYTPLKTLMLSDFGVVFEAEVKHEPASASSHSNALTSREWYIITGAVAVVLVLVCILLACNCCGAQPQGLATPPHPDSSGTVTNAAYTSGSRGSSRSQSRSEFTSQNPQTIEPRDNVRTQSFVYKPVGRPEPSNTSNMHVDVPNQSLQTAVPISNLSPWNTPAFIENNNRR
eukprot:m.27505 g.27505  ORF g.27505 m.27505 type:complete len:355 (-) comp15759_c0_seq3:299-1363(-)